MIRGIERWAGRQIYVEQFGRDWINRYLEEIDASPLSKSTVRQIRVQLIVLWKGAFDAALCEQEPKRIRKIHVPWKTPVAWSHAEVSQLANRASQLTGMYWTTGDGIPRSLFWDLLIHILWDSGIRQNDAMRVKLSDIDDNGLVVITQHKTGRPVLSKLSENTMRLIARRRELAIDDDRVCPWFRSREHLGREFQRRLVRPLGMKGTLKKLRKSSGTDAEVQQAGAGSLQLGHAPGSSIAAKHYLDIRLIGLNHPTPRPLKLD